MADVKGIPVENLHQTPKSILIPRLDVRRLTKASGEIEIKTKTNFGSGGIYVLPLGDIGIALTFLGPAQKSSG